MLYLNRRGRLAPDMRRTGAVISEAWITMVDFYPPRHIVWSTQHLDLTDSFQRGWYLRQVLSHGRTTDIRRLDLAEVERELDTLQLPAEIWQLWKRFLEHRANG